MSTTETHNWLNIRTLIFIALGIGCVYLLVSSAIDNRFSELELNTRLLIEEQETLLSTIAVTTARNGADEVTESIITDCSIEERSRFDDLLSSLNDGLSRAQLTELERLFGRCGSFYSERKALMVARLTRELEIYEARIEQLALITGELQAEAYAIEDWNRLVAAEQNQSQLFAELVQQQDEIITTLLAGSSADSPEIRAILQEVREIQETLIVANKQASTIRSELVSL